MDFSAITPLPGSAPLTFEPERTPIFGSGGGSAPTLAFDEPPTSVAPGFTHTPRPTRDVSASPTPDATRVTALDRKNVETYTVKRGDTLNEIGERYGVTAAQIAQANNLKLTDPIFPGQVLLIPLPDKTALGPAIKLLPDSEFVYGPSTADFNLEGFIRSRGGYLATYSEEIDAIYLDGLRPRTLTGAEIVRLVATRYSVHPRLLLAVIEQQSGWVTNPRPDSNTLTYPLRRVEVRREGLFRQLSWAANQLNLGYYGWRAGWLVSFTFETGGLKIIAPGLNAGTVGVQNYFARVSSREQWLKLVGEGGFRATYDSLFGNPFRFAEEPLVPPGLVQPELALPFEPGKVWAFTGGPHGAWDSGSAWAALD
ncbi:MAG: LysM peptidoglycan-binding domain-containing protein, partial [Anaerolineales bacterium]|nr:LysM peptidoglycan-binding domain-containing protein [Anaerolineales bacterium]